ncbi:class I SAM-dependent methyltransferase [Saccharopolyspora oryzae]|uniref:Class I SAM-dependent methyltransferase n=2 Tax=Saccharopolyspora oryzae TaxID=2997343 RepID=A0ABT4UU43_9PSEU|nr:class I SAM-dependent methyltransferase [Saccharopolyspora oryzae]MDA3625241.1 class I SAM-dependent methyltransferase [Saccharopolyspora oryzae]
MSASSASGDRPPELRRFQHPRFGRFWVRVSEIADRRGAVEHRRRLVSGTTGRVLEIGSGNGRNFQHYPASVTEVVAVEPNDELRVHSERNAASAPVPVRVVPGHADALPGESSSFDGVVLCQVLCSVPDPASALREIRRVLRPQGKVHFLEHVRSSRRLVGAFQEGIAPIWRRLCGGCELHRDTASEIEGAGFALGSVRRFGFSPGPLFWMTYVLGTAAPDDHADHP